MIVSTFLPSLRRPLRLAIVAALALPAACDDNTTAPTHNRMFDQVQRLGNPLVSEVLLQKRDHPTHGSIGPAEDASLTAPLALAFLTGPGSVAGRSSDYANVLGSVLIPDMLIVQTDKDPGTAAWLNWVGVAPLANGWGGRKLEDDVVDLALLAVFGDPFGLDPSGANGKDALTTDSVPFDSPGVTATFPYLAPPN
ncbi:MAG TPA: DUF4331 family protein [Gemmatimonadales bacterium]|jgi:hypothetical protein|nr:DUF4331 family protein [Gemmatimonadales bacterium]